MLFCVVAIDKPDSLALRMATREAHFAYAKETGVIRLGGPFLDGREDMAGSLIIFESADIESAHSTERQLETDRRRLEAERQAQATHLRVEATARGKLNMRAATPANTQYVVDAGLAAAPVTAPLTRAPVPSSAPDARASQ